MSDTGIHGDPDINGPITERYYPLGDNDGPPSFPVMFSDQGMEMLPLETPVDPRGGFTGANEFFIHSSIQNGGIVNAATGEVTVPFWNDGANP